MSNLIVLVTSQNGSKIKLCTGDQSLRSLTGSCFASYMSILEQIFPPILGGETLSQKRDVRVVVFVLVLLHIVNGENQKNLAGKLEAKSSIIGRQINLL